MRRRNRAHLCHARYVGGRGAGGLQHLWPTARPVGVERESDNPIISSGKALNGAGGDKIPAGGGGHGLQGRPDLHEEARVIHFAVALKLAGSHCPR
jgi:hypothetical protein